ncbi:MAG: toxin-antitoxin system TumE family protein [Promethearchaeia archaeon]
MKKALIILEKELSVQVKLINFEPKLARIHIFLRDNTQIFIKYNNYGEYSYSLFFSKRDLDRCRFDNYDDKWDVSTRPHHFHPRFKKEAITK